MRERQNADLGFNNMYVVPVPAHAEFALNPRRQEPTRSGRVRGAFACIIGVPVLCLRAALLG